MYNNLFNVILMYIILLYFWIYYYYIDINELYSNLNDKCICILTRIPTTIMLDFLNSFSHYDIYVVIDDNSINYTEKYKDIYKNINFIQIEKDVCIKAGYQNITLTLNLNGPCAWEKALYYFSRINLNYNYVWFIEDDVYFYNEDTILNIDNKYPESDFLSNKYETNETGKTDYWHWGKIMHTLKYNPPYYSTMCCAVRMSKNLLQLISDYAKKNNTLFFLEVMYPTLTIKNNLKYDAIPELYTIVYRKDWKKEEVDTVNLFHPIKNHEIQKIYKTQI